jgi:hypothetical protein
MQLYRLVTGNTSNIEQFEQTISALLEEGYSLEGSLITAQDAAGTQLFQAMISDDYFLTEEEDEEDWGGEDE